MKVISCPKCQAEVELPYMKRKVQRCPQCERKLEPAGVGMMRCGKCEIEVPRATIPGNCRQCTKCGSEFNVITRTVDFQIRFDKNGQKEADLIKRDFHRIGQFFMDQFQRMWRQWRIVAADVFDCSKCKKKAKAIAFMRDGSLHCRACAKEALCGQNTKDVLVDKAKSEMPIPRLTYYHRAYDRAVSMFDKWISDNIGRFLKTSKIREAFDKLKDKYKKDANNGSIAGEDAAITNIREQWLKTRGAICVVRFANLFLNSTHINKSNRAKRRQMYAMLTEDGKLTDIPLMAAKGICEPGKCPNLEKYEWGWDCKGHLDISKSRPTNFPRFPKTIVLPDKESYNFEQEALTIALWEKTKEKPVGAIMGLKHFSDYWKYPKDFDNRRYPTLCFKKKSGQQRQFFFYYPKTGATLIQSGNWQHIVVYGFTRTCVVSTDGQSYHTKFFGHGEVIAVKEYWHRKRVNAQTSLERKVTKQLEPLLKAGKITKREFKKRLRQAQKSKGFFTKPRDTEAGRIESIIRNEVRDISQYLKQYPGKVILIELEKSYYPKGTDEKDALNRLLSWWPESVFRFSAQSRLEPEGFKVEQWQFNLKEPGHCPYCKTDLGLSFQDLALHGKERDRFIKCSNNHEFQLSYAIAKQAQTVLLRRDKSS